jgi:cell division protein FtsI/penicillin-binding protein 2
VKQYKANKGRVIVMNPKTGDIIAMANYPSFDLNNF